MIHLLESYAQLILTYGNDVWGANKAGGDAEDKILLGECGEIPPGVSCETNCISFSLIDYAPYWNRQ